MTGEQIMFIKTYRDFSEITDGEVTSAEELEQNGFYSSLDWYANLVNTTLGSEDAVRIYRLEAAPEGQGGRSLLFARCLGETRSPLTPRTLFSLTGPYSVLFEPSLPPGTVNAEALATSLAGYISKEKPIWDVLHFDCLDPDSTFFGPFVHALRQNGYRVQPYFHFGNWYEPVAGLSLDEYLNRRPSALRNTLKRKLRRLEKSGAGRFDLSTGREDLEPAISAYHQIYRASWKQAEPFPNFTEGLIRAAAAAGSLRIGVLYIEEEPAAAQVWIAARGRATIFKLAYDQRFKEYSAGSLLTLHMLQHALESDGMEEIDFGRGDDPYKSQWMSCRRERWGIMAFSSKTVRGTLAAGIHLGGGKIKKIGSGMVDFTKTLWR